MQETSVEQEAMIKEIAEFLKKSFLNGSKRCFPKRVLKRPDDGDETNVEGEEVEVVKQFGRKQFGELASPFRAPDRKNWRYLDTQHGIRKEGDNFEIGDSMGTIDNNSNIVINGETI